MPSGSFVKYGVQDPKLTAMLSGGFNLRIDTTLSEWERLKHVIMRNMYNICMRLAGFPGTANLY